MNTMTKMAAGAVLGGSMLVAGGFGLANAAPAAPPQPEPQSVVSDGQVNVVLAIDGQRLGVMQNVSLTSAQALATAVCPGDNLASRLTDLDTNQVQTLPVCDSATGGLSYTFTQNAPGNSELAPAQNPQSQGTPNIGSATTTATPAPPSAAEGR